ncbi:MAG TPA: transglycosylase SLT domain-containing protein [Gemmatimonadales bacterium]|jgi:membrane-bound lytic murein transglycosylase D
MRPQLILCGAIAGLSACASNLPPAPAVLPAAAIIDTTISPLDISVITADTATADALVLNDLAATAPDEKIVPAFDGERVRWDIDVETYASHPRVQYYLGYFDGVARSRMEIFLQRGARYEQMIRRRFEAAGLPGDLGYLALIESGYSNEAVSHAYAVGMWQFMRGTGRGYGLRVDSWVDERRDPVKATDAAARHLKDLRDRFGSLYLAAAAYNAGAGKVSRSLGRLQWDTPTEPLAEAAVADSQAVEEDSTLATADTVSDASDDEDSPADINDITSDAAFFRLASADLLATETQDYVPKLIASAIIAKAPGRYGIEAPVAEPFGYDSIVVTDVTGLDVIAKLAGTGLPEIRDLNPQYLRLATPPRSTSVIRLPSGTGETVAEGYGRLRPSQRVRYMTHRVSRPERLTAIAARYHLPVADVRAANPRVKGSRPRLGTVLVIPAVAAPSALAMRATGAVGSSPHRAIRGRIHRVRRGETLTAIARRYRVSVRSLTRVNSLASRNDLRAGMRLRIPG